MSIRVKRRLDILKITTTHEDRVEIDKEIERRTNQYCDNGIDKITDAELIQIVGYIRDRKKKKEMVAIA